MTNKAFTLMELIVVIAIIVILIGAAVPATRNARSQAQQARASADSETIKTAALMLHNDTGSWPPTGNAGNDLIANYSSWPGWNGPYLDQWKNDPWGSAYAIYDVTGTPTQRWVESIGPDKTGAAHGTGDDIGLIVTPDISK